MVKTSNVLSTFCELKTSSCSAFIVKKWQKVAMIWSW